jgi:hypothetical protein
MAASAGSAAPPPHSHCCLRRRRPCWMARNHRPFLFWSVRSRGPHRVGASWYRVPVEWSRWERATSDWATWTWDDRPSGPVGGATGWEVAAWVGAPGEELAADRDRLARDYSGQTRSGLFRTSFATVASRLTETFSNSSPAVCPRSSSCARPTPKPQGPSPALWNY